MEENKNKALEKAEKAQIDNINYNKNHKTLRQERKLHKQRCEAEKNKALAQKRLELARLKAIKKAEREKQRASLIRERNRKEAELRARKEERKREKEQRRQMLKSESKKERERREHLERIARQEQRQRIRQEKAKRRQQILADKKAKREQKLLEKSEKRKNRQINKQRKQGFGGWLAAVISLGVCTLVLASVLTFTLLIPSTNDNMLENGYQSSFYDTVEQIDNIDLNLSKILATKDAGAIQKYLVDVAINSEIAEKDIQQLPLHDESKFYTAKLINQIGDYSKYLNNKIIDGQNLTINDRQGLEQLYNANLILKDALQEMTKNLDGYSFSDLQKAKSGDVLLDSFNQLQNLSVQYPELIYDGPFSDGQEDRIVKGINGKEMSFEQIKGEFVRIFNDYKFSEIIDAGESEQNIACYNVEGIIDGQMLYAQMSKVGGHLIMFSYAGDCNQTIIEQDKAIENAQEFLKKLKVDNMQEVWINLANNVYTINFACEQNGIILYPDLIKVRVCAETGKVIGIEATSYYANHTSRKIPSASLSVEQAKKKVFDKMQIESSRLVVVPIGLKSEKLCYEFSADFEGQTYYVYIDAISGKQVQMFKVIEGTEGTLLM